MVSKQTKENKIEETGTKEGGGEAVVGEEDKAALLDGHKSSIQELRCMLAPFVLRRLKCDVLRQMPPKIGASHTLALHMSYFMSLQFEFLIYLLTSNIHQIFPSN